MHQAYSPLRKGFETIILLFFTTIICPAGTVTFSNFNSKLEIQSDGTPINSGFVSVGTTDATEFTDRQSVYQSSNNIGKDNWSDVLLFNIDGQFATSPHRVRKNRGAVFFRLKED